MEPQGAGVPRAGLATAAGPGGFDLVELLGCPRRSFAAVSRHGPVAPNAAACAQRRHGPGQPGRPGRACRPSKRCADRREPLVREAAAWAIETQIRSECSARFQKCRSVGRRATRIL